MHIIKHYVKDLGKFNRLTDVLYKIRIHFELDTQTDIFKFLARKNH